MINSIKSKFKNASANDKIVYRNVAGAFIVKGGALVVSLYTIPSYLIFFHNDSVLGVWFTVLSFLNWILNFDLGIGNGLRNHLSTSISIDNREDTKRYISSAYFAIGGIVLVLAFLFPILIHACDLNGLLSINTGIVSAQALQTAMIIVVIGVLIQFWLKLINSVLYALQKSSINNLLVLITNVIILLSARFLPSQTNDKNIIVMAIVHAIAVALPLIAATIVVFTGKLRYALPRFTGVSKEHVKQVLSLGGVFFFVQIAYMVIMSTNEFLITRTSGSAYNVDYQVYYKLFSLGSTVFALALTPIWSVITKAKAERQIGWIKKTYHRFMRISVLFCAAEFAVIIIMRPLMQIWLGANCIENINVINGLIFATFSSLMIINSVLSSIANGIGALKVQAVCFGIGAIIKVPLSYLFVKSIGSWTGVVLANIFCMALYCLVQPVFLRKYFKLNT